MGSSIHPPCRTICYTFPCTGFHRGCCHHSGYLSSNTVASISTPADRACNSLFLRRSKPLVWCELAQQTCLDPFTWNLVLYVWRYISSWWRIWYHMIRRIYDVTCLWCHENSMISKYNHTKAMYDIKNLWIIRTWYRHIHMKSTMISYMISLAWNYDIIVLNLWYIICKWYHRHMYHIDITCLWCHETIYDIIPGPCMMSRTCESYAHDIVNKSI
jgi:hypothetical protein